MSTLRDGKKEVRSIAWMALFRNSATYLRDVFGANIEKVEESFPQVQFSYYFLENDSKDETRALLEEFMKGRKGRIVGPDTPLQKIRINNAGTNYERIERLGSLRNLLLDKVREDLKDVDWVIMFDADVIFDKGVLEDIFNIEPAKNDMGLITPFAMTVYDTHKMNKELYAKHKDVIGDKPFVSLGHYYDTYALYYKGGHNTWPHCMFESCIQCKDTHKEHITVPVVPQKGPSVIEIDGGFGGFAVVDAQLLQNKAVRWDWIQFSTLDFAVCEHYFFCQKIREQNKKVILHKGTSVLCLQ